MASSQQPTEVPTKEVVGVIVSEKGGSPSASVTSKDAEQWAPGLKKKMPWIGIGALFFVTLASIGQMIILLKSNGQSASQWPNILSPNVCLSILNGAASLAIAFAVVQGVAIAWWRQALQGASISRLHHTYNFSNSVLSIFTKYKYFNAIALAALMAKVAIIDGILFQRAIQTYVDISFQDPKKGNENTIQTWVASEFPTTAYNGGTNTSDGSMTFYFSNTVGNWLSIGNGINTNFPSLASCTGAACLFGMNGTGFAVDCQVQNTTDNFVVTASEGNANSPKNRTIFNIDMTLNYPSAAKPYQWIGLTTTWPVTQDGGLSCPTTFSTATCELRPSLLNYTIFYVNASTVDKSQMRKKAGPAIPATDSLGTTGGQLTYSCAAPNETTLGATIFAGLGGILQDPNCGVYDPTRQQIKGVEVLQSINITEDWIPQGESSLLGIFNTMRTTFKSQSVLTYSSGNWSVSEQGLYASLMTEFGIPYQNSFCNYTYYDPRSVIINQMNGLMATTSVDSNLWDANDSTIYGDDGTEYWKYNQQTQAREYYKDVYYRTDKVFMGAAMGLTLLVIICILPSYWGFWQLGRNVTLGPMEIAYAFQGPAFQSATGMNGHVDVVVKTVGDTNLKYGEIHGEDGKRVAFRVT